MVPFAVSSSTNLHHSKIRELTERFCHDAQEIWQAGPPGAAVDPSSQLSPFCESKQSSLARPSTSAVDVDVSQKTSSNSELPPSQLSPVSNASGGEDSEDEDELFAKINLEGLKQRGKGSYQCPLGHRCDKGGVDKHGRLVVFDRNSSFAYASYSDPPARLDSLEHVPDSLTHGTDNTVINIESHGGATFLGAQTLQRNASLPDEMASRDIRPQ